MADIDIQRLRFDQKEIGKTFSSSKIYYIWEFILNKRSHKIEFYDSRISGGKKITLDGSVLFYDKDDSEFFTYKFTLAGCKFELCKISDDRYDIKINGRGFKQLMSDERNGKLEKERQEREREKEKEVDDLFNDDDINQIKNNIQNSINRTSGNNNNFNNNFNGNNQGQIFNDLKGKNNNNNDNVFNFKNKESGNNNINKDLMEVFDFTKNPSNKINNNRKDLNNNWFNNNEKNNFNGNNYNFNNIVNHFNNNKLLNEERNKNKILEDKIKTLNNTINSLEQNMNQSKKKIKN